MSVRQGLMVGGTYDVEEAFAFAADRDFDFVELDMEQAFPPERLEAETTGERIAEHGLEAVVHLPYRLDVGSPHEHVREGALRHVEDAIDAAVELGAEKGVVHARTRAFEHAWDDDHLRDLQFDAVERLQDYGRERGLEVCVENLRTTGVRLEDFPDLLSETDAAICLDTGHAHATGHDGDAQAALLDERGDRVSHVHLNDTRSTDDEHLPVGLGRVDFGSIADTMRETEWSGTCTYEIYGFDLEYAGHGKARFDRLLEG